MSASSQLTELGSRVEGEFSLDSGRRSRAVSLADFAALTPWIRVHELWPSGAAGPQLPSPSPRFRSRHRWTDGLRDRRYIRQLAAKIRVDFAAAAAARTIVVVVVVFYVQTIVFHGLHFHNRTCVCRSLASLDNDKHFREHADKDTNGQASLVVSISVLVLLTEFLRHVVSPDSWGKTGKWGSKDHIKKKKVLGPRTCKSKEITR